MKVMGLFSGIGGFELSLSRRGIECAGLCEIDDSARTVLEAHFPDVAIHGDITKIKSLPEVDIVTAGFPCQDLSQAGSKVGIQGKRSRLVGHVFRLLDCSQRKPEWIILENVSYMLKLKQGDAMQYLLREIEDRGYNWAYRVLDARCFDLPQRRERVLLLMSKVHDPSEVLFPSAYIDPGIDDTVGAVDDSCLYGFYWTEGKRGLGWTKNAVPTIKGGSGLGIPSPPAIWNPENGFFGTPVIQDAERLFGYPADWTKGANRLSKREGDRWRLVGNTICVPMVDWLIEQMFNPKGMCAESCLIRNDSRPPVAAYGLKGKRWRVDVSTWAKISPLPNLKSFLRSGLKPLSLRASQGFYSRAKGTTVIRFAEGFLDSLAKHIEMMGK